MSDPSPLGRYSAATDPSAPPTLVEVQLLGVPLRLMEAGREHHDTLMREFRLLALSGRAPEDSAPSRLTHLTQVLGVQYANAAARRDADVDAALERGDDTIDLTYEVPPDVAEPLLQLEVLMAEADEFCRAEHLLTVERSPALRAFTTWYLGQFTEQAAGRPPQRWQGPVSDDQT